MFHTNKGSITSGSSTVSSYSQAHGSKVSLLSDHHNAKAHSSYAPSFGKACYSPASQHSTLSTSSSTTAYSIESWGSTPTVVQPPLPRLLNPALEYRHNDCSFAFRVTSTSDISRHSHLCKEPATHPPAQVLNIKIPCLSTYVSIQALQGQGVTLEDIARYLVSYFKTGIQESEYRQLPSNLQQVASAAFNSRTSGNDALKRKGMIRGDLLGHSFVFAGLQPVPQQPDCYVALLRR